jgi:quinol-cytochrome oxidoreductase complex cytochrome b subunit
MSLIPPETVKTIFDELKAALPVYVPALPSILLGLGVTIGLTVLGTAIAMLDRKKSAKSDDTIVRYRWIVIVLVFAALGTVLGDFLQDKDYTIRCMTANRQHYCNVHWLAQYMRSVRA